MKTKNFYFKLGLLGVVLLSLYTGLADSDWYWQVSLGESIVKSGKFNDFSKIIWGTSSGFYLDHEWLSNIIFYLLSLLPYGMIVTKFILVSLCCLSVYLFIKLSNKDNSVFIALCTLFILTICSLTVFKVKPYMFSFIFLLFELYFLDKLDNKSSKIGLFIISVLWVNMHGSYILYLAVFGIYVLLNKKGLKCLIVSVLGSLINPFSYKLLLFNFMHSNDKMMKVLIQDWKAVDCKTFLGVVIFLVIALYIFIVSISKNKSSFSLVVSLAMLFLTLSSARHMLYFVVSIIYLMISSSISEDFKVSNEFLKYCSVSILFLGVLCSTNLLTTKDYEQDYMFDFVDDSTVTNINKYYKDKDYNGLFISSCFNSVHQSNIKTFTCGIYPLVSDRVKDEIYMTWYSTYSDIEQIIDYYKLTGFVVDKYSCFEGYSRSSVLYQYLISNDDYICLNDSDYYGFFVKKSIADKTK